MKKIIFAAMVALVFVGCGEYYDEVTTCTENYDGSSVTCKTKYRSDAGHCEINDGIEKCSNLEDYSDYASFVASECGYEDTYCVETEETVEVFAVENNELIGGFYK